VEVRTKSRNGGSPLPLGRNCEILRPLVRTRSFHDFSPPPVTKTKKIRDGPPPLKLQGRRPHPHRKRPFPPPRSRFFSFFPLFFPNKRDRRQCGEGSTVPDKESQPSSFKRNRTAPSADPLFSPFSVQAKERVLFPGASAHHLSPRMSSEGPCTTSGSDFASASPGFAFFFFGPTCDRPGFAAPLGRPGLFFLPPFEGGSGRFLFPPFLPARCFPYGRFLAPHGRRGAFLGKGLPDTPRACRPRLDARPPGGYSPPCMPCPGFPHFFSAHGRPKAPLVPETPPCCCLKDFLGGSGMPSFLSFLA